MARTSDVSAAQPKLPELAAPRYASAWASLVYAVSTMLLAYPALAGKFLINARSDQYLAGYAFREFAAQSLRSGHGFPQWNPFLQGGLPYIAAMHGDIFYPTFILRWLLPTDVAMTWEFIIHLFLAGLFTYFFLRAWNLSFWASLVGGLAYMLGGSIAGFASPGHDGKLFVSTLTPLGLLLITRSVRDGRRWAWGALAVAVGLAFLSPHPQLFQYFLLLAGSFSLYVAFADHPGVGKLPRDVAIRRLAFALGAVVLGIIIGAVQYWPALIEYKPWSPRAGGHDWAIATSYSFPIEETLNAYWPQFTGILDNYWGRNGIHLHSDYFGAVVLVLAGAAFGRTNRVGFRRFWWIAGLVSLIWALGGYTPVYHLIMLIPYTKYLRAPSTMIFVTALCVSVLAALGTDRVIGRVVSRKYAVGWIVAAAVFALLMTVGGYTALANAVAGSIANGLGYPPEAHSQIVDQIMSKAQPNTAAAIIGVWRSFLFAGLAAAFIWGLLTDRVSRRNVAIALVVLVIADLWSVEREYWIFSPPASTIFASDPAIDAIKADIAKSGEPGRVFNPPAGSGMVRELGREDRYFSGDKLMVHGIRVPAGYHGNELGMYQRMMALQIDSLPIDFSPQFWRHENVRYLYTAFTDEEIAQVVPRIKAPPLTKLAGPVRNSSGSMVSAYKVGAENSFAHIASAMAKAPQDQALSTVLDPRFDPQTVAIVDTLAKDINPPALAALPSPSTVHPKVTRYEPGLIDLSLDQPSVQGQALVVSENYFPGWHATVDGKLAPVALMNYNLIGVPLPAGARAIELRFDDAAYEKGKSVTLVALVLAIV
ncbi:MAG TPA: YfhO family protein, partial [Gemmatimonadaceae bacterium]|nr:YfhO family protein [Gemmatimonadaceae bacterium]